MPDFTVASTTDTQEAVNQAAGAQVEPETEQKPVQKQPEPPKEPEKTADPAEKSIKKMERRIDKLTARENAALEENAALKQRLAALEQASKSVAQPAAQPEPQQAIPETKPKPKQSDFETYEDYVEAVSDWKYDQRRAKEIAEAEQVEMQQAEQQLLTDYQGRVKEFRQNHPDWEATMSAVGDEVTLPPGVGPTILELENGPEVAYYLAKHPETTARLWQMSNHVAIAEVGRLAATLGRDEAIANPGFRTDRQPVSNAPEPIKPLTGHSTKSTKSLDELDYQEYRKLRDQQEKNRYRR